MIGMSWKHVPLGFALLDESKKGAVLVHHVSIGANGTSMTGLWDFADPEPQVVQDLITHRIVMGTRDGIERAEKVLGRKLKSARLAELVAACEEADEALNAAWLEYRDEEPKKRAHLKPLAARTWPPISEDGDAARILKRAGLVPFPSTTPADTRDIIALSRLVEYVVNTWYDLETDRLSRSYLNEGDTERRLYPPDWLDKYPPFWPKVA